MLESNEATHFTEPDDEFFATVSNDAKKAAVVKAFEALRAHGDAGIERNLDAAAAIAALKISLVDRGDFGRFCKDTLQISTSYRARLLKLNKVRDHVSSARAWAATQKHRLAECQSAQNLIKLVNDWLKRDEAPKLKAVSKTQGPRPSQDDATESEPAIQQRVVAELGETISELKSRLANRDDAISDLERRLAECDQAFVALRDRLPEEVRERALGALSASRDRELAAIAKRFHWRENDLRRELENRTAV